MASTWPAPSAGLRLADLDARSYQNRTPRASTVEASGHPAAFKQCLEATRQGGTVSVVGIYEQPIDGLDMGMVVVRDLTLCCSVASPNAFEPTLRLMAAGKIQTKPLVTHVLDLAEAPKALEIQPEERIKIHLRPPVDE